MIKEPTLKQITNYYIEKASMLSFPFDERYRSLREKLGDCMTEDIANEWSQDDLSGLKKLFDCQLISERVISLYRLIVENFDEVSFKGSKDDESIWTLDGLESHPFWEEQRKLAKELLTGLKKALLT